MYVWGWEGERRDSCQCVALLPRGRVVREPGHTEVRRQFRKRDWAHSPDTTTLSMAMGLCVCEERRHGWCLRRRGGVQLCSQYELSLPVTQLHWWHQSASQANLLPAPRPCVKHRPAWDRLRVCVFVCVWRLYTCGGPYACVQKEEKKKWAFITYGTSCFHPKQTVSFKAKTFKMHTRREVSGKHSAAPV